MRCGFVSQIAKLVGVQWLRLGARMRVQAHHRASEKRDEFAPSHCLPQGGRLGTFQRHLAQGNRRVGMLSGVAMGQQRSSNDVCVMSAIIPTAAQKRTSGDFRVVPGGDIVHRLLDHLVGAQEDDSRMLRPSAFAVFRLITRSNLLGCSTGTSTTLVPRNSAAACRGTSSRQTWTMFVP